MSLKLREFMAFEVERHDLTEDLTVAVLRRGHRRLRRRSFSLVAGVAAGAVLVVAGGGVVVSRTDAPQVTQHAVDLDPAMPFPYVTLDGPLDLRRDAPQPENQLVFALPDGTTVNTGLGVQEVLGQTSNDIIVSSNDSHLSVRTFDAAGQVGPERRLAPGPVRSAVLSWDDTTVAFIDNDDTLHVRRIDQPASEPDVFTSTVDRQSTLLAVDHDTWVLFDFPEKVMTLHRWDGSTETQVPLDTPEHSYEAVLAAGTLIVGSNAALVTYDQETGTRIEALRDATRNGLSRDGSRYVTGSHGNDLALGSVATGDETHIHGVPDAAGIGQVVWQGSTRFFVETIQFAKPRALWSCTVEATCTRLSDLPDNTVQLPAD